jgi:hypothetical protein
LLSFYFESSGKAAQKLAQTHAAATHIQPAMIDCPAITGKAATRPPKTANFACRIVENARCALLCRNRPERLQWYLYRLQFMQPRNPAVPAFRA